MQDLARRLALRLVPLVIGLVALGVWMARIEAGGPYLLRNLLPPFLVLALSVLMLARGRGRFTGDGWRFPLAVVGFAIPAVGLSIYLHYAYSVNLDDMFGGSDRPEELFRFLPIYTLGAGSIGFLIGWITGRNV